MKVFITGGAGYIGTELIYRLAENKEVGEIVVYDNLSRPNYNLFIGVNKLPKNKLRFVQAEILDSRRLKKEVEKADVVVHLAALVTTPFADQNPHLFEQTNNWGTAELSYILETSDVKKLIYISSVSVYGSSSEEIEINTPLNPKTFYGISKMHGEEHIERLKDKMKCFIVRCGNVYGYSKSMRFDAVINRFMFDAHYKNRISINGDGEQNRSFIHVNKVAETLNNLIMSEHQAGTYNLVERMLSINDIVSELVYLYPEMEMLFTNQNLKLREIKIKPDPNFNKLFSSLGNTDFREELEQFKKAFSF